MFVRTLSRHGLTAMASAFLGDVALASTPYPDVPEPMIFDMMRPLGARRGELEVNTLATVPLSGDDDAVNWAPEVEYAVADGFAIEGELPFVNGRLAELKLGLQASFGTSGGGRTAHGIQYLGIYDRRARHYRSSFAYMAAHRYDSRWSSVTMAGLGDVRLSGGRGRNGLILNHSTFYDSREGQVLGLEVNYRSGSEGYWLLMPQWHQKLGGDFAMQAGIGADKPHGDVVRPTAGLRIIRQF